MVCKIYCIPPKLVKSSTCWWETSKKAVNDVRPLERGGDSGQLLWKEMKIQGSGLAFRMMMKKKSHFQHWPCFLLKFWANNSQLKDICKQSQRQLSQ